MKRVTSQEPSACEKVDREGGKKVKVRRAEDTGADVACGPKVDTRGPAAGLSENTGNAGAGEATDVKTALRRAGTKEIVLRAVTVPPSAAVVEAVAFLCRLEGFLRCDFVMSVCEELGVQASGRYSMQKYGLSDVCILATFSSSETFSRILRSKVGGLVLVMDCVSNTFREFGTFLLHLSDDFDFSVLTEAVRGSNNCITSAHFGGICSSSSAILEWLIRDGLFNDALVGNLSLSYCCNSLALTRMVQQGRNVNACNWNLVQPLSQPLRTAKMVDVLIAAGAKPELLNGLRVPSVAALRRLLELHPVLMKAKFSGEAILSRGEEVDGIPEEALDYARLMRDFDYPTPTVAHLKDANGNVACALFTFQYTHVRPRLRSGLSAEMLWRPFTHYACPQSLHDCVVTALLAMRRVCLRVPRDIRNLLLMRAFGEIRFVALAK